MTIEEAKKMAEAKLKCLERDSSGTDRFCNHHRCDECRLNYEQGNVVDQIEWLRMSIKALELQQDYNKGFVDCRNAVLDLVNADWKYEGLEIPINSISPVTPNPYLPDTNDGNMSRGKV